MEKRKEKIVPKYIYKGCGFPVEIKNVRMKPFRGDWVVDLNLSAIDRKIAMLLVTSSHRLTGEHVKFLRLSAGLSQRDFAKILDVSHVAVLKWESFKSKQTNMDTNTERMIRFFTMHRLGMSWEDITRVTLSAFLKAKTQTKINLDAGDIAA